MSIQDFDISVIYTREDGSYVINKGLYHVPNEGEWTELWAEVNAYAKEHPEAVQEEPVYKPSEQELLLNSYRTELYEKESWLRAHDYIGVKIATGRATAEDYADEIATMTEYAARIEELRALMAELEAG